MDPAAGQLPDQPGLDGSEKHFALLCPFPESFHILQHPLQLRGRQIAGGIGTAFFLDHCRLGFAHTAADFLSPIALPADDMVNRIAAGLVPYNKSTGLNRDSQCQNISGIHLFQALDKNLAGLIENFGGILLHPAGLGVILMVGQIGAVYRSCQLVKKHGLGSRGTLIDGCNVFHRKLLFNHKSYSIHYTINRRKRKIFSLNFIFRKSNESKNGIIDK